MLKFAPVILLTFFYSIGKGQAIEYRNDSLFVNKMFVDAATGKKSLDSLLGVAGKEKTGKDDTKINPATGKKVVETTWFYYPLGLYFKRYDYDATRLTVCIKLYHDTDPKTDKENGLVNLFKGQLIIAGNYINDKRQPAALQALKNCTVTLTEGVLGTYKSIIGGELVYKQNAITLSFDGKANGLTNVYIHHNLKR